VSDKLEISPEAAASRFLEECGLGANAEAVSQLLYGFLPCLKIICEHGHYPGDATWRAFGWRGIIWEMKKRMGCLLVSNWRNVNYDEVNATAMANYAGYYIRLKNSGPPFGDLGNPEE
jgi:hypothetical protein